jgi:hypothetical protein
MGDITNESADVYRDWEIANVPSSGKREPAKQEIRDLFVTVDSFVGATSADADRSEAAADAAEADRLLTQTASGEAQAALASFTSSTSIPVVADLATLDLAHAAGSLRQIISNPVGTDDGVYTKIGSSGSGSWQWTMPTNGMLAQTVGRISTLYWRWTAPGPGHVTVARDGNLIEDVPAIEARVTTLEDRNVPRSSTLYWRHDGVAGQAITVTEDGNTFFVASGGGGAALLDANDLLSVRNNTNKAAIPNELATNALVIVQKGQSLADQGGAYAPDIFDTVPINPDRVFIPDAGISPTDDPWTDLKPAVDEYYNSSHVTQGSNPSGATSSRDVALGNAIYEEILADSTAGGTAIEAPIVTFIAAAGGTSIADLGQGTVTGDGGIRNMQRTRDALAGLGFGVWKMIVVWIHDNEDSGVMSGPQYERWLIAEQAWDTANAKRMFGEHVGEVIYYLEQSTVASNVLGNVYAFHQVKLNLCRNMPYQFRWLPAGYDWPHGDGTHGTPAGYRIRNRRNGKRIYRDLFRGGRAPMATTESWWSTPKTRNFRLALDDTPLVLDISNNSSVVTFNALTDVVTLSSSVSVQDGQMMTFINSGGAPSPEILTDGTPYYWRDASGFTGKLALSLGGTAINLSTNGTGTTTAKMNGDGILYIESVGVLSSTVTFDAAADTVLWANHNFPEGTLVRFTNSGGAPPPELTASTTSVVTNYYTKNGNSAGFQVAATSGGATINLSTAGTGTTTGTRPAPYVTGVTIVDDGTHTTGNDPDGLAEIAVGLSSPPMPFCKRRFLFGQLQGPAGTLNGIDPGGVGLTLRNSAPDTCDTNRNGDPGSYPLYIWSAREENYV